MRLLLVSDLHYRLLQLDWVVRVAPDYDVVVIAGDVLNISSIVEPDAQIAVVLEYLARIAATTTLVVASGNHDLDGRNEHEEKSARWHDAARDTGAYVDGTRVETDTHVVTVCPWWDGPLTRAVVDAQLALDASVVGGRGWIWVYHAPPDASPTSWTGSRHYGDEALFEWIERYQPALVLCGHVHQSPFASDGAWVDRIGTTLVMNPGHQIGAEPTHVEIDTTIGTARWTSMSGVEERVLASVE